MDRPSDLLGAFEPIDTEQWHAAIERFLKGQPLESLHWELEPTVSISPLRRRDNSPAQSLQLKRADNNWHIAEAWHLEAPDQLAATNASILSALQSGTNALLLSWNWMPSTDEWAALLQGVELAYVWVHARFPSGEVSAALDALLAGPQARSWRGSLAWSALPDPAVIWEAAAATTGQVDQLRLLTLPIVQADSTHLAQALYQASQWMDAWLAHGGTVAQLAQQLRIEVALPAHYFTAIAYLRAARRLWLALLEAYQAPEAVQPWWHAYTVNDAEATPHRNMLVGTSQALSAVMGGVDSLLVTPSDDAPTPTPFARRMARNVQHLMQAESYLDRVVDPAAGAYYIEHLTEQIAERAWQQFCTM